VADIDTVIDEARETSERLAKEIQAMKDGIVALDKAVAEATEQRKKEDGQFKELMASDGTAKGLLNLAKKRLNEFYNPKLAASALQTAAGATPVPAEQADPLDAGGLYGGSAPDGEAAAADDGSGPTDEAASFLQTRSQTATAASARARAASRAAPGIPPETAGAYRKKSQESGGAIEMMNILITDLDKEMAAAKTEEQNAQEEYERLLEDSANKRAEDAKSLTDKEANKAAMEATVETSQASRKSTVQELTGAQQYLKSLHQDCDWLMKYYDVRKEARADEMDALNKAKAVLNGADYSFLQVGSARKRNLRSSS